jgi:8-amino-7-oxononanoate synthase
MTDVAATLEALERAGLHRELREIESAQGPKVTLGGREVLLLCSNDYLGLAGDPRLRAAAAEAAERWGAGAGASRLVSGNMTPHRELEQRLAELKGTEACVLFGSGYLANTGVVAALAGPGERVISDELNHASLVDGCRLARAETVIYPHGDLDALAAALGDGPATVVTDAVFSMDGDVAPLAEIAGLAQQYGARLIVDEAHATGVIGRAGRGLAYELGVEPDVVIGTLGKALGSYGAFACCSAEMRDFLVNRARTLIFSTALPPPSVGAAIAALELLDETLVARLHANARTLRAALGVQTGDMPIVPLIIGAPEAAVAECAAALEQGAFAQAIRPPTVPPGTSRLRVVAMASHTPEDLETAAHIFRSGNITPWRTMEPSRPSTAARRSVSSAA